MGDIESGNLGVIAGLGSQQMNQDKLASPMVDLLSHRRVERTMKEFWEVSYNPNEPLEHKGTLTFNMPGLNNSFIDPSSIRLIGDVKVQKSANNGASWDDLESGDKDKVSLINFPMQSMFSQAHIVVNGASISHVGTSEYAYKAYFENLASYSTTSANSHLVCEGYLDDVSIEDQTKAAGKKTMHDISDGAGNEMRSKWISEGKVGFNMPIHLDFCQVGKLWLDLVPIQICMTTNEDKFTLLAKAETAADGATATQYKIVLDNIRLECRRIGLIDSVKEYIESYLQRKDGVNRVRYPMIKSTVKRYHIPSNSTQFHWNGAENGKLPFQVVAAFVDQEAASGHLQKNPLALDHFNLDDLYFTFNNVEYPNGHYRPAFDKNMSYLREFGRVVDNLTTGRFNTSTMITHERWRLGNYCVWAVDQTPDSCSGFHTHIDDRGQLSIAGKFASRLEKNITMLLYSSFTDELQFDAERKVYGEGSVVGQ